MLLTPATNIENWEEYCNRNYQYADPIGFLTGTQEAVSHVQRLVEKTTDYTELKNELLSYLNERELFLSRAKDIYALRDFGRKNVPK